MLKLHFEPTKKVEMKEAMVLREALLNLAALYECRARASRDVEFIQLWTDKYLETVNIHNRLFGGTHHTTREMVLSIISTFGSLFNA